MQSRLNGEATSMLCYGASLTSVQLLWKHQLLDVLMPPHASYLRLYQTSRSAMYMQRLHAAVLPVTQPWLWWYLEGLLRTLCAFYSRTCHKLTHCRCACYLAFYSACIQHVSVTY